MERESAFMFGLKNVCNPVTVSPLAIERKIMRRELATSRNIPTLVFLFIKLATTGRRDAVRRLMDYNNGFSISSFFLSLLSLVLVFFYLMAW